MWLTPLVFFVCLLSCFLTKAEANRLLDSLKGVLSGTHHELVGMSAEQYKVRQAYDTRVYDSHPCTAQRTACMPEHCLRKAVQQCLG